MAANPISTVDTGRKLNVHKTFRRRPGRLLNEFCTFNLRTVSTGSIPVNLSTCYNQIFLVKMVVEILIVQAQKIDDCRQQSVIKRYLRSEWQTIHSTLSLILSSFLLLSQSNDSPYQCAASKHIVSPKQYPNNEKCLP